MIDESPILESKPAAKKRLWPIAMGPTVIKAGESVNLQAFPQVYFRGNKIICTGDEIHRSGIRRLLFLTWCRLISMLGIALAQPGGRCFITGLFIGSQAQLPLNTNPISTKSFDPGILDNVMLFDTCQPALAITMQIENRSDHDRVVSFTIFGNALDERPAA